jgi:hypothetical protein
MQQPAVRILKWRAALSVGTTQQPAAYQAREAIDRLRTPTPSRGAMRPRLERFTLEKQSNWVVEVDR